MTRTMNSSMKKCMDMGRLMMVVSALCAISVSAFVPSPRVPWVARSSPIDTCHDDARTSLVALSTATSSETDQRNSSSNNNNRNNNRNDNKSYNNNNGNRRNNNNYNNGNRNNSNNQRRAPVTSPMAGARRGGGGASGGALGGAAGGVLKLENPLKVQRIVAAPQAPRERTERGGNSRNDGDATASGSADSRRQTGPRPSRGNNNLKGEESDETETGGGYKRPRAYGSTSGGPEPASGNDFDFGKDGKRKRQPSAGRDIPRKGDRESDGRNRNKNSLRLGTTTKKGRNASMSSQRGSLRKRDRSFQREAKAEAAELRRTVYLPDGPVSVSALADIIDEKPVAVIKFLMTDLGVMASMTQNLDPATCVAVAEGFGKIVAGEDDEFDDDEDLDDESALEIGFVSDEDEPELLQPRPPVVTIMGHVDHGKTSLLDAIRNTRVTAGEAGGITQHIAAYQVDHNGQLITFIDTPGHAAFTDMRQRGANITDIVILVVAADDGVKQQTADSIVCARQAGVPLVVAINKIDLDTADPVKVMTELTAYDVLTEDFGGDVLSSQISAKKLTNLDDLLDKVMLQAEVEDLKANPDRTAEAIVIEAYVEKGLGTVATSLVKKGTLKVGDIFVAGETYGKVRALISTNDEKTRLDEAGPSVPVRIVGFEGIPSAGDALVVMEDEQTARTLAESRQRLSRERSSSTYQDNLMDSVTQSFGARKERREMCVLVKADVQGSAQALTRALQQLKLENDEAIVSVKVLVSEAGEVSKSDVTIASVTPGTTIIAFGVAASVAAMEDARVQKIPIEYYSIVYDAIESVESRMQEILSPTPDGEYTGSAVVQEVFNIGGTGNIAGSRCQDGVLRKGGNVRVMRGDKILVETKIKSLRNFKAESDNIEAGNECGIGLLDFEDFEPGDIIECYVV